MEESQSNFIYLDKWYLFFQNHQTSAIFSSFAMELFYTFYRENIIQYALQRERICTT